ncbi:hypothetical protein M422DRAFT_53265 [Sphaerobolus stellatus SS14]|uniref:Unplaced genomic scaffold SPHSTscaffold_163, whole genome shotgun sequence n=1 Tax=Sphaerobolus stellatus (strain SS14) TaxID=990650 RepID=A0A0C9V2E9_SPHS4|nr:hypothetical protein M422DRAFT_53265 [Sphaerobolus stellatus SS14]
MQCQYRLLIPSASMQPAAQSWKKVKVQNNAISTINPNEKYLPQELLEKIFYYFFNSLPITRRKQLDVVVAPSDVALQQEIIDLVDEIAWYDSEGNIDNGSDENLRTVAL